MPEPEEFQPRTEGQRVSASSNLRHRARRQAYRRRRWHGTV